MKTSSKMNVLKSSAKNNKEEEDPPDSLGISVVKENTQIKQVEPEKEMGSFLVEENSLKKPKISYEINKNHFKIKIFNKFRYSVKYPRAIFTSLKDSVKKILVDNFIYCRTIPVSLFYNPGLFYQTKKPFLKNWIDYGLRWDLPRVCMMAKTKPSHFLKKINEIEITFQHQVPIRRLIPSKKCLGEKAVLSISFGKDSLLSYALSKEVGLDCYLVFIKDMEKYNPNELKFKKKIVEEFSREQREKVIVLTDDTDNIFRNKEIKNNVEEFDGTNAILAFTLELIPVAYYYQAKYIIFGNEKNLDDFFINDQELKIYPSYDQSSIYMKVGNNYLRDLTNNNVQIISLIKPLYNIAEARILYHRYPHLLKYLMSCSSNEIKNSRWCGQCSTCAWAFLYAAAVGSSPKKLGINANFFERKYGKFYVIFNPEIDNIYNRPPQVREEQFLAFLLAYKNGYKGALMNLFKSLYLKEVEKREKELREKFFGIHSTNTVPKELKDKVLSIYREELKNLS